MPFETHIKYFQLNYFMHNVVKWANIFLKSCGVHTARFLKYVWPFYKIMHERVTNLKLKIFLS